MLVRIHVYRPHVQRVVQLFYGGESGRVGVFGICEYAGSAIEKVRLGCPRAGIFGACHRVSGDESASQRMISDALRDFGLGGAGINHDLLLLRLFSEYIQCLRQHLDCRAYWHGHYHDVASLHAVLEGRYLIRQPHAQSCLGSDLVRLDSKNFVCEASSFQVNAHRATDEPQSYYPYRHNSLLSDPDFRQDL